MVWGFFCWSGTSSLYRVNGILDQTQYKEVLEN